MVELRRVNTCNRFSDLKFLYLIWLSVYNPFVLLNAFAVIFNHCDYLVRATNYTCNNLINMIIMLLQYQFIYMYSVCATIARTAKWALQIINVVRATVSHVYINGTMATSRRPSKANLLCYLSFSLRRMPAIKPSRGVCSASIFRHTRSRYSCSYVDKDVCDWLLFSSLTVIWVWHKYHLKWAYTHSTYTEYITHIRQ